MIFSSHLRPDPAVGYREDQASVVNRARLLSVRYNDPIATLGGREDAVAPT